MSADYPTAIRGLALVGVLLAAAPAAGQVLDEFAGAPPDEPLASRWYDANVVPAAMFQPPALSQPSTPAAATRSATRRSRQQLASVPNMFGDFGMMTARVLFDGNNKLAQGSLDIPGAGGSRRVKVGENNSPLPQDRVFFMYNHFHNVYEFQETQILPFPQTLLRQEPIDRYTLGVEKTFFDGDWSVELRLPLNGSIDTQGGTFAVNGGHYGNLAVIVKRLCYADDSFAVSAGLGLDLPTGSEAEALLGPFSLTFENESVHLLPYLGVAWSPWDDWFVTGFLQVDVDVNGSGVIAKTPGLPDQPLGPYNDQNLLFVDLGGGYWLYRDPYAEWINGVAALLEFHYTTALQDTDAVFATFQLPPTTAAQANITNPLNRFDVVNVSAGVNIDFGETANLRVAGVFPLGDAADNRFFDSEVQVQFNHRF